MQTVSKRHGMIITVVLAVLFGCAGIMTCVGVLFDLPGLFGAFDYLDFAGLVSWMMQLSAGVCGSLAFIALPVVFWFLLVRGRPDDAPPAG